MMIQPQTYYHWHIWQWEISILPIWWWRQEETVQIYTDITSRAPKLEWVSWTHTAPYIAKTIKKIIKKPNFSLDTLSTEHTQHAFTDYISFSPCVINARGKPCITMIARVTSMPKTGYELKAMMKPAHGAHHRLRSINAIKWQRFYLKAYI